MIRRLDKRKPLIALLALVIVITVVWKRREMFDPQSCEPDNSSDDQIRNTLGTTPEEACKRISTRAEEIRANGKATGNIIAGALPIAALFNPNNYRSGDNTSKDMMRNIINTELTSCDITKISNSCEQGIAVSQINSLDNTKCPNIDEVVKALGEYPTFENITQQNLADITQKCMMNTAIQILLEKKSSLDAQALAKVLQEAQDPLSGDNVSSSENCNIINKSISTVQYIEERSKCGANLIANQENKVSICGNVSGLLQDNNFKTFQECIKGVGVDTTRKITDDTKIKKETSTEQKTKGVGGLASFGSLSSVCVCSIGSIVLAFFVSQGLDKKTSINFI